MEHGQKSKGWKEREWNLREKRIHDISTRSQEAVHWVYSWESLVW